MKEQKRKATQLVNDANVLLEMVDFPFEVLRAEVNGGHQWAMRAPKILLTLAGISPAMSCLEARAWNEGPDCLRPNKQWIALYNEWWGKGDVSSGTYDYFLRNGLRPLIDAGLAVVNPDKERPPNSPATCYGLSIPAAKLLKEFSQSGNQDALAAAFVLQAEAARAKYISATARAKLQINLGDGRVLKVASDHHNALQKSIVEVFLKVFVPSHQLIYIGETGDRELVHDAGLVDKLKLQKLFSDKLPDVVAYDTKRDWIIIVEAYHSSGAIGTMRHDRLKQLLGENSKKTVFVTAFATRSAYKTHANEFAWKTEVWIADEPEHLIHFDGERFLGPYA